MNAIYLAGPIEGIPLDDAVGWRNQAKQQIDRIDPFIQILDPCRRVSYREALEKGDMNAANRIVKMDLGDIDNAKVILANIRDTVPGKKWGTLCELAYAHTTGKVIVVLMDKGQFMHPFVAYYATEVHTELDMAVDAAMEYFN